MRLVPHFRPFVCPSPYGVLRLSSASLKPCGIKEYSSSGSQWQTWCRVPIAVNAAVVASHLIILSQKTLWDKKEYGLDQITSIEFPLTSAVSLASRCYVSLRHLVLP